MLKGSPLLRFLILFSITYIIIVFLHMIPFVKVIHTSIFVFFQELVFNIFHPTIHAKFSLIDREVYPTATMMDFTMDIYTSGTWKGAVNKNLITPDVTLNQDIRLVSQGPLSLLLALIIATPSTVKRKLIGLLIGILLLYFLQSIRYTYLIYENAAAFRPAMDSLWVSFARLLGPLFRTAEFMMLMMIPVWAISLLDINKIKKLYS